MSRFLPSLGKWSMGASALRSAEYPSVVGLNAYGAAWMAHNANGAAHWRYVPWLGATPEQALELLHPHLSPAALSRTALVLAPSMVRHWLQTPPAQVASLNELRTVAAVRCSQLFGASSSNPGLASGWSVSANWHASQAFVCAGVPTVWIDALQAKYPKIQAGQELVAHLLQQNQSQIPRSDWLALVVAHTLYLLRIERGNTIGLRTVRMPTPDSAEQMQQTVMDEWARETLRTQAPASRLHWLCPPPEIAALKHPASLQMLPYAPANKMALPPALHDEIAKGVAFEHVQEAQLTAWCAQQSALGGKQ